MGRKLEIKAINEIVGRNIKAIRLGHHMSQRTLGSAVGVSFQQVRKYESGDTSVTAPTLVKFSEALNCSIEDLFDGVELLWSDEVKIQSDKAAKIGALAATMPDWKQELILSITRQIGRTDARGGSPV